MVEKKRVVELSPRRTARKANPDKQRCAFVFEDGRRCRQRRWAGKKICFQHDRSPEAVRKRRQVQPQETGERDEGLPAADIGALLARTAAGVLAGEITVGKAYAVGYLSQMMLAADAAQNKNSKLDVKHFWEMVDLGATLEDAAKLGEKRKKEEKERKAREKAEEEKAAAAEEEAEQKEEPLQPSEEVEL